VPVLSFFYKKVLWITTFYQSSLFSGDKVKASNSNNGEKLNFRLIWRYYCNFLMWLYKALYENSSTSAGRY